MFLTFVVALCAGLANLSPGLAAVIIPFILAAYLRTVRAARALPIDLQQPKKRPGLLRTFGASIALFVALFAALLATVALAGVVLSFSLIAAAWRLSKTVRSNFWRGARLGWKMILELSKYMRRWAVLVPLAALINWSRTRAFAGLAFLFGTSRQLLWSCWHPDSKRSVRSSPTV
jgi:hypothetical protein